jgi:hypothetical protein
MTNQVSTLNTYGKVFRNSFIGIARYPDERQVKVYLNCEYYPKAQELKDKLNTLSATYGGPVTDAVASAMLIPQQELSNLVIDLARAVTDTNDLKRFCVGCSISPNGTRHYASGDVVTHQFVDSGSGMHYSSMNVHQLGISGLQIMNILYSTLIAHTNLNNLREFDRFVDALIQIQKERLLKIPIKFITAWDEEHPTTIGWTE